MSRRTPRGVWFGRAALVCLVLVSACASTPVRWNASWSRAYSRFDGAAQEAFADARRRLDSGDRVGARADLATLWQADPDNLEIGAWLQDVESQLLEDGVDLFAPESSLATLLPDDVLRKAYAAYADREPTVARFVLAARAETDVLAAETLLGKALELDPTCAWAHYGLAHILLQDRTRVERWGLARSALESALKHDPGHLRARRLEAWMLAEEGLRDAAERLLRRWIEVAEGDPRVSDQERVDGWLDLALLLLLKGEDGRAERMLGDLEGEPHSRARRLMLLTVARQEGGDALGALDAALRAQGAARGTVLPLVQEALLQELFLDNPEAAEARWKEIANLSSTTTSVSDLIQGLRARVRIERQAAAGRGGSNP